MLLNRLTYRSNKTGCKAFYIFNFKPCQKCAKATEVGCYGNTRFAHMTTCARLCNELNAVIGLFIRCIKHLNRWTAYIQRINEPTAIRSFQVEVVVKLLNDY